MKLFLAVISLTGLLYFSCTKKAAILIPKKTQDSTALASVSCNYNAGSSITYNNSIKDILHRGCSPCHDAPGSGGINLDSYLPAVALAKSGELQQVVAYTPGEVSMPPPPQKQLDSCEIKALTLWIKEGCPQN